MTLRGIRGATTVKANKAAEILDRTCELVETMAKANLVRPERISMALFTRSPDLDAAFPAGAVRRLAERAGGEAWRYVPMMCTTEIGVPGSLPRTIRVLLLAETSRPARAIRHQYLREAECLRPDLVSPLRNRRSSKRSAGGKR